MLFLCFFAPSSDLLAQAYSNFKKISNKDGLSQVSVFAISEDSDGFLWFGTRDGLNKYDGYHFTIYKNSEDSSSIIANDIRSLYQDRKNENLWIGTLAGLNRYNSLTDNFKNFTHNPADPTSISADVIRSIIRDKKGRLWIGTGYGLNIFNEKTQNFQRYNIPGTSESNSIEHIFEDQRQNLWFCTRDGLFLLQETNGNIEFVRKDLEFQLSSTVIVNMVEDKLHNYWIATSEHGLNYYNNQTSENKIYQSDKAQKHALSHNNVRALYYDDRDRLWVGTFEGLNVYNEESDDFQIYKKSSNKNAGLTDNSIKSIYQDRKGSLWIGTYYGGINHLDEGYNQFHNFVYSPYDNELSADVISSFAQDEHDNLWIGTEGGGLNFYNAETQNFSSYRPKNKDSNALAGNNVKQLLLDGDYLWIGTFNEGLDRMHIPSKTFTHYTHNPDNPQSISDNNVYGLLRRDQYLWILTYGGGLTILDLDQNYYHFYNHDDNQANSISSDLTRVILETAEGTIWIGTSKGINRVSLDENGLPNNFESFLDNQKVYTIQEDHQKNIWVGTISNGLYKFDTKSETSEHYSEEDGLSGNTVYGILEDDQHFLWISTNKGISKFDTQSEQFINFNNSNGLSNSEFNFNAYYKTKDGELLFGGINGYTRFNPNEIKSNRYIPKLVFTGLSQNNIDVAITPNKGVLRESINKTERLYFNYNEANFTIEFAALDFFNPKNNHYAFKLEGIDKDWNHTIGEAFATYTIQREGNYLFRLKGGNSDGIWNPIERQIEIVVFPPPWKTWWAYSIYALLLLLSMYALVRYIQLRESFKLEKFEKKQQDELHQMKLKFFTNVAHEFRTPLTLIIGPLEDLIQDLSQKTNTQFRQKLMKIYSNSQRMLNLVNQLMTFRRMESGHEPLQIQACNLQELLQQIYERFEDRAAAKQIQYAIDLPAQPIVSWIDKEKIEKVLSNLLSNAFKFTENGGQIRLILEAHENHSTVLVQDTGKGIPSDLHEQIFQRFYEKNISTDTNQIKGTGIGLSLSKQLMELQQGELNVESKAGKGSTFHMVIRKGKAHFKPRDFATVEETTLDTQDEHRTYLGQGQLVDNKIAKRPSKSIQKILLVDDNEEILAYLCSIFIGDYKVLSAENGLAALEKVKEFGPDIIISDLMMPKMDGIELCQKIKTAPENSHIPVILLTARSMMNDRLDGLESGANDYIAKPFHPDELRLKVRNILAQQAILNKRIKENKSFQPEEVEIISADEEFLATLMELVEKNISNPDFKLEQLAHELAVSRALLFTKTKVLTEMTPKNFIKSIRMKRAIQLLETGKLSISEVAYQVGFNEPKYFSKVFQKEFGKTPSEYILSFEY